MEFWGRRATKWDFWDEVRQDKNSWENPGRNATNIML